MKPVRYFVLAAALLLLACSSSQPLLNSERIEKKFGSYGVEILRQDEQRRETSLYSLSGEARTTRTYAIVEFIDAKEPSFHEVHEAILEGGSIGATFRAAGWTIQKESMAAEEIVVPIDDTQIGQLMRIGLPAKLATWKYEFVVSKNGQSFDYARITEIYHPDYMLMGDLSPRP